MSIDFRRAGLGPVLAGALALLSTPVLAAGTHAGSHDKPAFGQPGKAAKANRTVEVVMDDVYFEPEKVSVLEGETVRFVVRNAGTIVHEFNIGTPAMHAKHQEEMQMMVDHGIIEGAELHRDKMKMDMGDGHSMSHDHANSVLLEPGETAEVVWTFGRSMDLEFACNVPGHYDAGMAGEFRFVDKLANR